MASINVKVPVSSVLISLRAKLNELHENKKKYEAAQKAHEAATDKWRKQVYAMMKKNTPNEVSITTATSWRDGWVNVSFPIPIGMTIPDCPEMADVEHERYGFDGRVKEISHAIRLLEMTTDEYVNASTFKTISNYL